MKRVVLSLLFFVTWVLTASAQNSIQSIRKAYQEVHEMIDKMTPKGDISWEMPPEFYDLHVVQNLPGTGKHEENIRMFYGYLESEEEGDPFPPHYLRFTTAKYNFAAREYYEEYLYDDKGQVMFIYAIMADVIIGELIPYELRLYFDGERLLRFTAKKYDGQSGYLDIASLRKAIFKEEFSGTVIPEKFGEATDSLKQRAKRFLTMFKGIDDNTYQ